MASQYSRKYTPTSIVSVKPFLIRESNLLEKNWNRRSIHQPVLFFPKISLLFLLILSIISLRFPVCLGGGNISNKKSYIALVSVPLLENLNPLKSIAKELLIRGYRVSLSLPEIYANTVEDIQGLELIPFSTTSLDSFSEYTTENTLSDIHIYDDLLHFLNLLVSFQNPMYSDLYNYFKVNTPDMVIVDRFTFAGYDLCHKLKLPYIVNNPFFLHDLDEPPAYIPAPYSGYPLDSASVWKRCLYGYYRMQYRLANIIAFRTVNKARMDQDLPPITSRWDLVGQRLVLTNTAFGFEYARPLPPLFQMVGPLISQKSKLVVVEKWLNRVDKPAVYIDFGKSTFVVLKSSRTLINALMSENIRIVWALDKSKWKSVNEVSDSLDILLIEPGFASSVLEHPKISFFLSNCDFSVIHESLYEGKPILGIPVSLQQNEVALRMVNLGVGIALDVLKLNEQVIRESVLQLLENSSFVENAVHVGGILSTSGGVNRAVDLIISAIDFGTEDLIPAQKILPWYKVYLVDVYLVYGGVLCGVTVILRTIWTTFWSLCETILNQNVKAD